MHDQIFLFDETENEPYHYFGVVDANGIPDSIGKYNGLDAYVIYTHNPEAKLKAKAIHTVLGHGPYEPASSSDEKFALYVHHQTAHRKNQKNHQDLP